MSDTATPRPLYQTIKGYVVDNIKSGAWAPGEKIPSEAEIVKFLGASRMTVNRALRELSSEGHVTRVQGVGTFVAEPRRTATPLDIRSIAEEIAERGNQHSCKVISCVSEPAPVHIAQSLQLTVCSNIFHVVLVHLENNCPIQVEDRYVNPNAAPEFLSVDFTTTTPSAYLLAHLPVSEVEHKITSRQPTPLECSLLELPANTPMLELNRRSWSGRHVVTNVKLSAVGTVFSLGGRFKTNNGVWH